MYAGGSATRAIAESRGWKANGTKPAILFCPPHLQTAQQLSDPGWMGSVVQALAEAGYLIVADTLGSTTNWGNAAAATAVGTLKTASASTYGAISAPVGLLVSSMGMLPASRYYMDNPSNIACLCGGVPAVDPSDIYSVTRTDYQAEIDAAHTNHAGFTSYLSSYSPATHASSFTGLPMQLHYATDDPTITPSTVTTFASATGGQAVSLGAVGHNPSAMDPATVLSFFKAHL